MANYKLKDFASALNDFNKSLQINPEFSNALTNRGIAKIELTDYQGAISDLTMSIRFNPGNGIV